MGVQLCFDDWTVPFSLFVFFPFFCSRQVEKVGSKKGDTCRKEKSTRDLCCSVQFVFILLLSPRR